MEDCDLTPGALYNRVCGIFSVNAAVAAGANRAKSLCDCSSPYLVHIRTDATQDEPTGDDESGSNRGVCFEYMQVEC